MLNLNISRKILFVLISTLISTIIIGCDRLAKENNDARISIHFPTVDQSQMNPSPAPISTLDFSTIEPTGFSGLYPINCFAVMASGPDSPMRINSCGRKDSTIPRFPVGILAGAIPAGQSIALDVPSGVDRVLKVIGFHAITLAACGNLKDSPNNSGLSKPYVLGEVGALKLDPGTSIEVPVPLSFNASKWFDDCQGPSFGGGGGSNGGIATMARLRKNFWPYNGGIINTCVPFYLELLNNQGQSATLDTPITIQIKDGVPAPRLIYPNCNCSSTAATSTTIPAATSNSVCLSYNTDSTTGAIPMSLSLTSGPAGFDANHLYSLNMQSGSAPTFEIAGPRKIMSNTCYRYQVVARAWNGSGMSTSAAGIQHPNTFTHVYTSLADCNSSTNEVTYNGTDNIPLASGSTPRFTDFFTKIDPGSVTPSFTATGSSSVSTTITLSEQPQLGSLSNIEFFSENNVVSTSTCSSRQLRVQLTDQYGTAFPAPAALTITVESSGSQPILIHPTADFNCGGGGASSQNIIIPAGSSHIDIPYKGGGTAGSAQAKVSIPAIPALGFRLFNLTIQ